jgi:hypothetical protein
MADECRHDRRNARDFYAAEGLGLRIRDARQRFLPTEHGPAALSPERGVTCEYQNEPSSKRPASSAPLAPREGTLPSLRLTPLARRQGEAKGRKQTMDVQVREPC